VGAAGIYFMGLLAGSAVTPAFLPRIPYTSLAAKGALAGLALAALYLWGLGGEVNRLQGVGILATVTAIASFFALGFTGSTPYTSRSGVKREMVLALPLQGLLLAAGLCLLLAGTFP
jgi:acetyl-CoA decarbonylase/synthase complex subunit gamma